MIVDEKMRAQMEYEERLTALLKRVEEEGQLIERMEKGVSILSRQPLTCYKTYLGETFKKVDGITQAVYAVYEDFDGSIKYQEYPL